MLTSVQKKLCLPNENMVALSQKQFRNLAAQTQFETGVDTEYLCVTAPSRKLNELLPEPSTTRTTRTRTPSTPSTPTTPTTPTAPELLDPHFQKFQIFDIMREGQFTSALYVDTDVLLANNSMPMDDNRKLKNIFTSLREGYCFGATQDQKKPRNEEKKFEDLGVKGYSGVYFNSGVMLFTWEFYLLAKDKWESVFMKYMRIMLKDSQVTQKEKCFRSRAQRDQTIWNILVANLVCTQSARHAGGQSILDILDHKWGAWWYNAGDAHFRHYQGKANKENFDLQKYLSDGSYRNRPGPSCSNCTKLEERVQRLLEQKSNSGVGGGSKNVNHASIIDQRDQLQLDFDEQKRRNAVLQTELKELTEKNTSLPSSDSAQLSSELREQVSELQRKLACAEEAHEAKLQSVTLELSRTGHSSKAKALLETSDTVPSSFIGILRAWVCRLANKTIDRQYPAADETDAQNTGGQEAGEPVGQQPNQSTPEVAEAKRCYDTYLQEVKKDSGRAAYVEYYKAVVRMVLKDIVKEMNYVNGASWKQPSIAFDTTNTGRLPARIRTILVC